MQINVLVLGAQGMLGHILYKYFKHKSKVKCIGTSRNGTENFLMFNAETPSTFWNKMTEQTGKIDYVINCIALLKNYPDKRIIRNINYKNINTLFPKFLEERSLIDNFRLIHISTDSVFSPKQKKVDELSKTKPFDNYDKSKLLGEVYGKYSLTIRTSIIGYDNRKHKGLIERVINSTNETTGFTNQIWSGSTVLELAKFIEWLIVKNGFIKVTKHTHLIHYAPIGPITKYNLVKNVRNLFNKDLKIDTVKSDNRITRYLGSIYIHLLPKYLNDNNIVHELKDLLTFEKQL